jgi:hypothetical protein
MDPLVQLLTQIQSTNLPRIESEKEREVTVLGTFWRLKKLVGAATRGWAWWWTNPSAGRKQSVETDKAIVLV